MPNGSRTRDRNPPRVAPRDLFDAAAGIDELFGGSALKVGFRVSVINLTNRVALYNFLTTFSSTHFVPPRTFLGEVFLRF